MSRKSQLPRLANDAGTRTTVLHGDEYGGPPRFGPVTLSDLDAAVLAKLGAAAGLTVEEVDGSPSGPVTKIVFPNGTLLIAGSTATFTPVGGGGVTAVTGSGGVASSGGAAPNITLAPVADKTILSNISGASAVPIGNTLSALLDNILGSTQGQIITRNAGTWTVLPAGALGTFLQSQGPGANIAYVPLTTTPTGPTFKVRSSASTSLSTSTFILINHDTVVWDSASGFNTATRKYTVPTTGKWRFDGSTDINNTSTTMTACFWVIYQNGTRVLDGTYAVPSQGGGSTEIINNGGGELQCSVGDVIEHRAFAIFTAGTTTVVASATGTWFGGRWMST